MESLEINQNRKDGTRETLRDSMVGRAGEVGETGRMREVSGAGENKNNANREGTECCQYRNTSIDQNSPEILTNTIYTPAFLKEQIGKLMRVEFLIGTNNLVDRIGILQDVGASYILLRSFENDSLVYCDINSIKFVTISTTGMYGAMGKINGINNSCGWGMSNNNGFGTMNGFNNMVGIDDMNCMNSGMWGNGM